MNNKLLIIVLSIFSWGCSNADDLPAGESTDLKIRIVDKNNQAFRAQSVRWWYSGKPDNKYQLTCTLDLCAEWVIRGIIAAPIVIRADTSIVKKNDKTCWDLYTGETFVNTKVQEVFIEMTYSNTACSSQEAIRR